MSNDDPNKAEPDAVGASAAAQAGDVSSSLSGEGERHAELFEISGRIK